MIYVGGEGEGGDGTFKATSTACVLLTIPTTTLPCLTASDAYSTWNIRPWGELLLISFHPTRYPFAIQVEYLQGNGIVIIIIPEHRDGDAASAACGLVVGVS